MHTPNFIPGEKLSPGNSFTSPKYNHRFTTCNQKNSTWPNHNRQIFFILFILVLVAPILLTTDAGSKANSLQSILSKAGILPAGFKLTNPVRVYGTEEKPLQDGSIFDYMDGGGVVYLKYGFVSLEHCVLQDEKENRIVIDVFQFTKPADALAAYADEAICPSGVSNSEINGLFCKAYAFSPEFFVYYTKNTRLVYIYVSNDELVESIKNLARQIYQIF